MKIGIFDSGVGGLIIMKKIVEKLPEYDYVYLGDTARVPYGGRSPETIYLYTEQSIEWLEKQGCSLIIVACNTASAQALRKIQQCFLPTCKVNQKVLGVIIPTVENVAQFQSQTIGVLATEATVKSDIYVKEFKKIIPEAKVYQQSAPQLASLIESGDMTTAEKTAIKYITPLMAKNIQTLVLGCTHYELIKEKLSQNLPKNIKVVSQGEFIPAKLISYLNRHPEIESHLSRNGKKEFYTTKITPELQARAEKWFGEDAKLHLTTLG